MTAAARQRKSTNLNIRIKVDERSLIDRAARARGQNRTDFILEAARRAAEEALLDRTMMVVDPKAFGEFVKRLDAAPKPNARLARALRKPAPWEGE
jgi:uncharacterized protein (DUF1778 family)